MKFTPWFPSEITPVHAGVYQVWNSRTYAYWNGKKWGWAMRSVNEANCLRITNGADQFKTWRGLAEKPN